MAGSPGEAAFMAVVLIAMFFCLFVGWKTPETVVFMCLVLVWNVGLVSTDDALSGFSNAGMLAVGALFVVIKGVEKSQLADKAARQVFGLQTSMAAGLARMMGLCFALSAFLNNTPVVALLIPITRDWARARVFSPSIFLIPLSYSCIMGGLLTVIGTSTNLVVQGLVLDEAASDPSVERIGFFEPGYVGLPLGIVGIFYLTVFAPRVLPSRGGMFRFIRDRAKELLTEVQVMTDFPYIGEPAGLVLTRLGLPQETLIKIRRKISPGVLRQMSMSFEDSNANSNGKASRSSFGIIAPARGRSTSGYDNADAIMEANQRTFKAQSMYSYRLRAEGLWGAASTNTDAAGGVHTLSGGGSASGEHSVGRKKKRFASADAADDTSGTLGEHMFRPPPAAYGATTDNGVKGEDGTYTDIFPVSAAEPIQAGDVLFLSCAQTTMIDFQSTTMSQGLKGLKFLDVSALDLPGHGTEFFEIVLSTYNHFVGRSADRDNSEFASYYGCSVVAVRGRGQEEATVRTVTTATAAAETNSCAAAGGVSARVAGNDAFEVTMEEGVTTSSSSQQDRDYAPSGMPGSSTSFGAKGPRTEEVGTTPHSPARSPSTSAGGRGRSGTTESRATRSPMRPSRANTNAGHGGEEWENVTESKFKPGDVVLVLAKEEFMEKYSSSKDFFLVTKVGSVPTPVRFFDYLPLFAFLGMLVWVLFDADMVQAAFAAGAVLIFGGWVDAKKTVSYVDWGLLLLIGSALGLSKGIVNSGLADYVGGAIRDSGMSADASLVVTFGFTMVCTELITNNAAAALSTPIAFSISRELAVSYKPFVMAVMMAASSSFITPIGYQTNTLVWGPGGYKFTDFMKIGTPLSFIYLVLGSVLIPRVFPF